MIEERFVAGDSIMHRSDPRIKILACILFIFTVASLKSIYASGIALLFSFSFLLLSNLFNKDTFKVLVKVNGFILFLWIVLPFTTPGYTIFSFWKLNVSLEGLKVCTNMTLKSNSILLAIISLILVHPIPVIGQALTSLKFPKKFCFLLLMTYRYINLIYAEYNRLVTAAKIRGFVPKTNLHTYKTIGYIFSMVLIKSYDRAQRIYQAMILRGFRGKFYSFYDFSLTKRDFLIGYTVVSLSVILIAIDIKGDYIFHLCKNIFFP